MSPVDRLPARLFRSQVHYRSNAGRSLGAGFLLKREKGHGFQKRVIRSCVLVYALRGRGVFVDAVGRRYAVSAGDAMFMPAGRPATLLPGPDGVWAEAFIVFPQSLEKALRLLGLLDPSRPVLRPGVDVSLAEAFDQTLMNLRREPDDRLSLVAAQMHALVAAIDASARRAQTHGPYASLVSEACRLIADHPDRKPDLSALLREANVSHEHFRKLFRATAGVSPNAYRIRKRIDHARGLLMRRELSIKQIAYQLGYPDPFSFSRQFKKVVGVSPRQFAPT